MSVHGAVWFLGKGHLAEETAVLAEVESVVGCEDDGGVVGKPHVLDHAKEIADPGVDHSDFPGVCRAGLGDLLFSVAGGVLPEAVGRLDDFTVMVGHVEAGVVHGGVPWFVGIPGVDVEEEVLGVVELQPLHGAGHSLCGVAVGFEAPHFPGVAGFVMVMGEEAGDRAFLPSVHGEGLEALVVVHAAAEVEGSVDHGGGVVAVGCEEFRESSGVGGERFPLHE